MTATHTHAPAFLSRELWFPHPRRACADGLLAIGGDLSIERLLLAYRSGIFAWTADPISWWSPDPRAIFEFPSFHVASSLRKVLNHNPFTITINAAFEEVMKGCAEPKPRREETWVTREFIQAYVALHQAGHAHSIECWRGSTLAGGVYGVAIGGFFAGESMFHRVNNASKVALYHLLKLLHEQGFGLFDTQLLTPATASLGAFEIPRRLYLTRLAQALEKKVQFPSEHHAA